MVRWMTLLLELFIAAAIFFVANRLVWRRFSASGRIAALVLALCAAFVSFSIADSVETPRRTLTITALGEKNKNAAQPQIYLDGIVLDGQNVGVPQPVSGQWNWNKEHYAWFEKGDERRGEMTTDSVTFELPAAPDTQLVFLGNKWKGKVSVEIDGVENTVDTYVDTEDSQQVNVALANPTVGQLAKTVLLPAAAFGASLAVLCMLLTLLTMAGQRVFKKIAAGTHSGPLQKLLQYQFLFEELVKRDFKKKYKRTVLGMAWSLLSPLLTLLVMRLVFTRFFGRSMAHYTTYLFCGNLVFSYFNESTSQGMTSLMGNAGIFTKVNVPKYLFLLSKNIQTLINFGLTLCVFFVFCIIDRITFTWKFTLLLSPICMLVLFNIGVGMILSALFVFFRDIQYLWSVFTLLLMYMSAIFYSIDSYSYKAQCAFLINPVYLFIRYFRKIVIEATIPTVWFHLLMAADVAVVLAAGCRMYKKYNTRFLYYV